MGSIGIAVAQTMAQQLVQHCLGEMPKELRLDARPVTWDITDRNGAPRDTASFIVVVRLSNGVKVSALCAIFCDHSSYAWARCSIRVNPLTNSISQAEFNISLAGDDFVVTSVQYPSPTPL